jgi:acetyl-CoA carboxylase biotin carboxyl carrier protein
MYRVFQNMTKDNKNRELNTDMVRQLAEVLNETDLNEIEYETEDCRIRVVRHRAETIVAAAPAYAPAHHAPIPTTEAQPAAVDPSIDPGAVKSPMVGNAYLSPEPDAAPFVKEGAAVKEGDTLLIIEAMKVMNPIKAPKSGIVQKIFVKEGAPIEFDEVLLIIT